MLNYCSKLNHQRDFLEWDQSKIACLSSFRYALTYILEELKKHIAHCKVKPLLSPNQHYNNKITKKLFH